MYCYTFNIYMYIKSNKNKGKIFNIILTISKFITL